MKQFIRILALMLALVLTLGVLAACSDKKSDDKSDKEDKETKETKDTKDTKDTKEADDSEKGGEADIKGETGTWGQFTFLVPEGYTLKGGDVFDENDETTFNINKEDDFFTYFMFHVYDEETVKSSVETTKEFNEGAEDVEIEIDGVKWIGTAYESVGISCFSMYADFGNDDFILVSGAGNAYDSEMTAEVLSSLEYAPAD